MVFKWFLNGRFFGPLVVASLTSIIADPPGAPDGSATAAGAGVALRRDGAEN